MTKENLQKNWPRLFSHFYLISRNGKTVIGASYAKYHHKAKDVLIYLPFEKDFFNIKRETVQAVIKIKSCGKSCSPSDYREGGKCEAMRCYKKTPLPGPGIASAFT